MGARRGAPFKFAIFLLFLISPHHLFGINSFGYERFAQDMRYDATSHQYIPNKNISQVLNGDYNVHVGNWIFPS